MTTQNTNLTAARLRYERERQGLSQADLEQMSGVSRTTIQSIERGTWQAKRQGPTLKKLSDALELELNELRAQTLDYMAFIQQWAEALDIPPEEAWARIKEQADADERLSGGR